MRARLVHIGLLAALALPARAQEAVLAPAAAASETPAPAAPPSATPAAAAPPAASVRASLQHLQLGVDAEAQLSLTLPAGAREVRVQASCGRVEALQEVAPGQWTARYLPPAPLYPQLAIIAMTALDGQAPLHTWTVLPLWGKGRAEVRTRPHRSTLLRIGENSFGPVEADASGIARVAVVVPPGFREGWAGEQRVDLQLPPVPRVYAMPGLERVSADADTVVPVRVYAVTPEGTPRTDGAFVLEAERGALAPLSPQGPGVYETRWSLPPGPAGAVALSGHSEDGSETFGARVTVEPGPARTARLQLQPEVLVAGSEEGLRAQVEAFDRGGNRVAAPLQLRWAEGAPRPLQSSSAEAVSLALPAPSDLRGRVRAAMQVLGPDGSVLTQREVALRAAEPAQLAVEGGPDGLEADGRTPLVLRVLVRDRFGNPVREQAPQVKSPTDPLPALQPTAAGGWELHYVPQPLAQERAAQVQVRAGALFAERALRLRPHRPRLSVAARAGLLANVGTVRSPTVGLQLHAWPRLLSEDLGLSVDLGYLPLGAGGSVAPGLEARAHAWLLAAGPSYRLRPRAGLELWVGAGPSVGRLSASTSFGGGTPVQSSGSALGVQGWVGASRRLGPGAPFVELRTVALSDPGLATLRGSLLAASLQLGYRLDLR
ncbi:hypothetical protein FGE12_06470 [Aggregicoccus sp. 17bor-14]|uniref:hypothetical protein n=1 Tax=Myxococcaceae TaxID=31 RepID=UPI00129C8FB0|nr:MULTISPECIES: hypothetical protein [Myxococcaceae]MBF5042032.1 hypothetical protein [Simulacricoccus sp. 17bor-14]MRI87811.1 hypothetical protein [Aggregicoccus sp. 17bor-14]